MDVAYPCQQLISVIGSFKSSCLDVTTTNKSWKNRMQGDLLYLRPFLKNKLIITIIICHSENFDQAAGAPLAGLLWSFYPSCLTIPFPVPFERVPSPTMTALILSVMPLATSALCSPCISSQDSLSLSSLVKNLYQFLGLWKWILPSQPRIPYVSIFELWSLVTSPHVKKLVTL